MKNEEHSPFNSIASSQSLTVIDLAKIIEKRVILISGAKGSRTRKAIYLLWHADQLAWKLGKLLVENMTDDTIRWKIEALIKVGDWQGAVDKFFGQAPLIGVFQGRDTIGADIIEIDEPILCETANGGEITDPIQAILLVD